MDNEIVSINGFITPIEHTLSQFHIEWDALANLKVVEPVKEYASSVFQSFLPPETVSVGECWKVEESGVLKLLRQLNPEPNLKMRIDSGDSNGLWACLRAYNNQYADIAFRIHAEFKLDSGFLTPSQFTGNLIVDRLENQIVFFRMFVPEATVNLDINWQKDLEVDFSITDAGFCSQMELLSNTEGVARNIDYSEAITQKEAERLLSLCFYKSEQINWVSPFEAIELSEEHTKLIHVISIDGPLKDESC